LFELVATFGINWFGDDLASNWAFCNTIGLGFAFMEVFGQLRCGAKHHH